MTAGKDAGEDRRPDNRLEHRAVVALDDAGERDGELKVVELLDADVDRILEATTEQEESGRVFCRCAGRSARGARVREGQYQDGPKRRLLMSANAFLSAAVCQRSRLKSLPRNLSMTFCSGCQAACFQSPWTSLTLPSAK